MSRLTTAQQKVWGRLNELWGDTSALKHLPSTEVARRNETEGTVGWQTFLPLDYLGRVRRLLIILPGNFPLQELEFWVDQNPYGEWPHAEHNGKLCIWPPGTTPVWMDPVDIVNEMVCQLRGLFSLVALESNAELRGLEFSKEWLSYWRILESPDLGRFGTLLLVSPVTEGTAILHAQELYSTTLSIDGTKRQTHQLIAAATLHSELTRWVDHIDLKKGERIENAVLAVQLHTPPKVPGAPGSMEKLKEFVADWAFDPKEAQEKINAFLSVETADTRWLVFYHGFNAFACLQLLPQIAPLNENGFRKSKRHINPLNRHRLRGFDFKVCNVQRVDSNWVHGRDLNLPAKTFRDQHVVLVGVGSVGSMLAESLVLSGVGKLTLIDPEILEAANIGRHVLGAESIGQFKATALRGRLLKDFPHATIVSINKTVQAKENSIDFALAEANLVISTTAEAGSEWFLMNAQKNSVVKSIMLAWAEPHALAGHSAHSGEHNCGLWSLFHNGECVRNATSWTETTVINLPGCGASHMPGAGNRIRLIAALIAEHAMDVLLGERGICEHRTWVAAADLIKALGGERLRPDSVGDAVVVSLPVVNIP